MIFPLPKSLFFLSRAPVTWVLVLINTLFMIATTSQSFHAQRRMQANLMDDYFMRTQGSLFAQYISDNPIYFSSTMKSVAEQALMGDDEKLDFLGRLGVNNSRFIRDGQDYQFTGDKVAIREWREKVKELRDIRKWHPSFVLGVSSEDHSLFKWMSYQFMHSGGVHYASNMIFLVIFGVMLEPIIGGLALAIVYLGAGMVAAGLFLLMSGATALPLVGASGAVSGLLALFGVFYWRRPVRYFYFLFVPRLEYLGFIYLPGWICIVMWGTSDLAGFLSTTTELGGIAYSAHLGGEVAGALVGFTVYFLRFFGRNKGQPLIDDTGLPKVGTKYPLADFVSGGKSPSHSILRHTARIHELK